MLSSSPNAERISRSIAPRHLSVTTTSPHTARVIPSLMSKRCGFATPCCYKEHTKTTKPTTSTPPPPGATHRQKKWGGMPDAPHPSRGLPIALAEGMGDRRPPQGWERDSLATHCVEGLSANMGSDVPHYPPGTLTDRRPGTSTTPRPINRRAARITAPRAVLLQAGSAHQNPTEWPRYASRSETPQPTGPHPVWLAKRPPPQKPPERGQREDAPRQDPHRIPPAPMPGLEKSPRVYEGPHMRRRIICNRGEATARRQGHQTVVEWEKEADPPANQLQRKVTGKLPARSSLPEPTAMRRGGRPKPTHTERRREGTPAHSSPAT